MTPFCDNGTWISRFLVLVMNTTKNPPLHKWRLDGSMKSIHFYSDVWPVTGCGIQGLVLDVILTDAQKEKLKARGGARRGGERKPKDGQKPGTPRRKPDGNKKPEKKDA